MSVCPADGKQAQENITIWIAKKAGSFLSPPPAQICQLALKSAGCHTGLVGMGWGGGGGAATVRIKVPNLSMGGQVSDRGRMQCYQVLFLFFYLKKDAFLILEP